jgi:hypothetical protein
MRDPGRCYEVRDNRVITKCRGKGSVAMPSHEDVQEKLYAKTIEALDAPMNPLGVLQLAEAFAWATSTGQSHGAGSTAAKA